MVHATYPIKFNITSLSSCHVGKEENATTLQQIQKQRVIKLLGFRKRKNINRKKKVKK